MALSSVPAEQRPSFVSNQVSEAHRYFLNLAPPRSARLAVVCGGCERLRADYVIERATFPYLCVEFVAEGAGTVRLRGREFPLRAGVVFAYAPGIPHLIRNDAKHPMRKYYIDFAGRDAAKLLSDTALSAWAPAQIASPHEVLEIFEALQRDAFAEGQAGPDLCAAHLRVLLLKIAQKALPLQRAEPRALASYQRAQRVAAERFLQLATAEELARACHMTPVHLSRLFQRFARTTPYQAILRLKMNRAAELLLDSGLLVKQAAEELGFSSPFQFSRAFKRVYGLAPDHFVRAGGRGRPGQRLPKPGVTRSRP